MYDFISNLLEGNLTSAKVLLEEKLKTLVEYRIDQLKKHLATRMCMEQELDENANTYLQGRAKVYRIRVRSTKGGSVKIQRRKRFSAVKGYTYRSGKLIKMSPKERRNRRLAARRGKFKRRSKLRQSLNRRKRTLLRRSHLVQR